MCKQTVREETTRKRMMALGLSMTMHLGSDSVGTGHRGLEALPAGQYHQGASLQKSHVQITARLSDTRGGSNEEKDFLCRYRCGDAPVPSGRVRRKTGAR